VLGHELGSGLGHGDEAVVLAHEVGFAVDFDQRAQVAFDEAGDHAFGGHARSGLASLGAQLDAQQLFSLGHVAVGLGQGLLALHHGGVGLARSSATMLAVIAAIVFLRIQFNSI
jgi:hypothetical protein